MPPKRKRADADTQGAPATRSTRSSTRTGTNATTSVACVGTSVAKGSSAGDVDVAPPPRKTRNTGTKATSRATTKSRTNTTIANDDKLASTRFALNDDEVDETNKVALKESQEAPTEPYTPQRMQGLFNSFADEDDRDVINAEGLENLSKE
ncbi:hypothetical protein EDD22DRAFT_459946 [Suillus occidentalis]|nr:hypothetical protein EDD22DRAFT_459946 [Suillus occidentalis]